MKGCRALGLGFRVQGVRALGLGVEVRRKSEIIRMSPITDRLIGLSWEIGLILWGSSSM